MVTTSHPSSPTLRLKPSIAQCKEVARRLSERLGREVTVKEAPYSMDSKLFFTVRGPEPLDIETLLSVTGSSRRELYSKPYKFRWPSPVNSYADTNTWVEQSKRGHFLDYISIGVNEAFSLDAALMNPETARRAIAASTLGDLPAGAHRTAPGR